MQLAHNSFVVVADGRKMMLLRNEGDAAYPNLEVVDVDAQDNPADRDQSSDRPGRSFQSFGLGHRSAYQETDFHQLEEDRFAAGMADILKQRALRGEFDALVVVAPPTTLGELRKHYHKAVTERLTGEVAKDLTGHPIDQIEQILISS